MRAKWFSIGCLTSVIFLILILILGIYGTGKLMQNFSVNNAPTKKISPNSYLHLNITGVLEEYTEFENQKFFHIQSDLFELIQKIEKAKNDDNIEGIILEPRFIQAGYATINELIYALQDFKTSGKKIYAYLKTATDKEYYLATVADKIYLNPSASTGIILTGVGSNFLYYKDLFDKIGVEMQVVHAGKFKGYGENFVRNNMSAPLRESISTLFDDYYDELIYQISKNRGIPERDLKNIYENRKDLFIKNKEAVQFKLVDGLIQREELLSNLGITEDNLYSINDYFIPKSKVNGNKIAVVVFEGSISAQNSPFDQNVISAKKYLKVLDEIEKDNSIKAVVLRVNSPGGSALESDIINEKIKKLKRLKKVVVSMSNVAASGGYYISSNADKIFADPLCITGSIGVVMMFPNMNKMGDKIGINSETIKKGKFVNFLNPWQPITESEKQMLQDEVNSIYTEFKTVVSEGRNIDFNRLEEYAQGRVWSAKKAKEFGLVDEIGTLESAIASAAEMVNMSNPKIDIYPKKMNFITEILSGDLDLKTVIKMRSKEMKALGLDKVYQLYEQIKAEPIQERLPIQMQF